MSEARQPRAAGRAGRAGRVWHLLERNNALLKHGIVIVAAGLVGNVVNYCYQIAMGRMLGPAEFGTLGALIAVASVSSVPAETIRTLLVKTTSKMVATGRSAELGGTLRYLTLRILLGSSIGLAGILAASGGISQLLKLPSATPVLILGIVLFLELLSPTLEGALAGLQRFARLGIVQILAYMAKLLSGIAFVAVGFAVPGALAALAVGSGASLLVSMFFLRDVLGWRFSPTETPRAELYSLNSLYTFFALLFLSLLGNVDVILVRQLFSDTGAGQYVAAMTVARVAYFGAIAIASVMFPKVASWTAAGKEGEGVSARLLRDTLIYVGLLAGFGALVLNLFSRAAIFVFFGDAYRESAGLVGLLSIAMLFRGLSHTVVLFHLARGHRESLSVLTLGLLAEVAGIVSFHGSLDRIAIVVASVWAGVAVCLGVLLVLPKPFTGAGRSR